MDGEVEVDTVVETANRLRGWALEAGFDRAGVARVAAAATGDAFLSWLDRGEHAGMGYLARRSEERLDPRRLVDGAKSALCVAVRYAPLAGDDGEALPEPDGDLWPRVARYARGRDYHNLMGKRLRSLAGRIRREHPGAEARPYVDTGPVLERELAARAGLGAVGKNTNLLHPEMGSWYLLGEILTTLDLGPGDAAVADLCGRCTLCLEACPTGALPEPYRLDANRCISYWTIEHRGAIPEEMRELLGDWVFGCDVCQEVCPWNRRYEGRADRGGIEPAEQPDLRLDEGRAELDLAGLLAIGEDDYRERFRGSAMQRAKRTGLRRNAALAMGNRGERRYEGALTEAAADADEVVAEAARWALARLG